MLKAFANINVKFDQLNASKYNNLNFGSSLRTQCNGLINRSICTREKQRMPLTNDWVYLVTARNRNLYKFKEQVLKCTRNI